jgi:riboflavin synthase
MFTGIVTQRAVVAEVVPAPGREAGVLRLAIDLEVPLAGTVVGDSVALDGCCLTVVALAGRRLAFDAIPETVRQTTLGRRRPGDRVNVEPALRSGDALGGHLVQGHVDGVGTVTGVERHGDDVRLTISLPRAVAGGAVRKGSICVDGVSLTVGECDEGWFSVYLIPHTLAVTGLGERRVGDPVNVEIDMLARYARRAPRPPLPVRARRPVAHGVPRMSAPRRRLLVVVATFALAATSLGCAGDARRGRGGRGDRTSEGGAVTADGRGGGDGTVSLSDQDLAPMDGYVRRRFWILGDDVEIVASKEYFIQNLSIAARIGFVKREDKEGTDEATSTLTFLGRREDVDFSNAPRVLIGTGISVFARHRLTIRFVRTTSVEVPVRLRIAANGDARLGMGSTVARREPSIVIGSQLRRVGDAYQFEEQ